jgi:hypothetical protein
MVARRPPAAQALPNAAATTVTPRPESRSRGLKPEEMDYNSSAVVTGQGQ